MKKSIEEKVLDHFASAIRALWYCEEEKAMCHEYYIDGLYEAGAMTEAEHFGIICMITIARYVVLRGRPYDRYKEEAKEYLKEAGMTLDQLLSCCYQAEVVALFK